jgi:PPOX class probable F420-dependent enzyme
MNDFHRAADHDLPSFGAFLWMRRRNAGSRIAAIMDFVLLRMRHRDAWSPATSKLIAAEQGFESLRGHKYCLLTTFRKSGEPVPTPVWFGLTDGKVYVESEVVGKVKRIRSNPRVQIAPCTLRGKPLGPPVEGRARILGPSESERAECAIADHYGMFRKLFDGVGNRLEVNSVKIAVESPADRAAGPTDAE